MPPADTGLEQQYQDAISNPVPSMVSMSQVSTAPQHSKLLPFGYNKMALRFSIVAGVLILIIGAVTLTSNLLYGSSPKNNSSSPQYPVSSIGLQGVGGSKELNLGQASELAVNGQIKANDSLILAPTAQPSAPVSGQIYFDKTTKVPYYYNGTQFVSLASGSTVSSINGNTGAIILGNGLTLVDNKLSLNSSVLQQSGGSQTTNVTNVTNVTGVAGLTSSDNSVNISNLGNGQFNLSVPSSGGGGGGGVASLQGLTGNLNLVAGPGISISGLNISNTGITSLDSQTGALSLANSTVSGSTITINDASTAQKGIAKFSASNFSVASGTVALAATGVSANTYGDAADVATFTVNAVGQLTAAGTSAVSIAGSQVSSGTVADARLSTNIAKYADTTANFTGTLQQNSNNVCTTAGNCTVGNGVGPGGAFTQGGNAFGAAGVLGTTDNFGFNILAHGATALSIDTAKNLVAANNLTVQGNTLTVGVVGTTAGQVLIASATAGGSITLKTAAGQSTAFSVSFPAIASADTICLQTLNNCSGVNAGSGDPNYIFNQNTQQTNANFDIQARAATVAAVIQGAAGQDITDFVNSSSQTVAKFDNSAQLTLGIAGTLAGKITLGGAGAGGSFSLQADPLQTSTTAVTLPADTNASDILCLKTLNNCAGSGVGGTGTANQVAYFSNSNTVSSSSLLTISGQSVNVLGNGTSLTLLGLQSSSATKSSGFVLGRTTLVPSDGALGAVGSAGDWSAVSSVGDLVLRGTTNNLILGIDNSSGNYIFATGPLSSETTKLTITNAGSLTFSQASTISTNTGQLTLNAGGTNSLLLQTGGNTALTIDNSGNTTLAANKNLNTSGSGTVNFAQTSTATSGINIGTLTSLAASPASAPGAITYFTSARNLATSTSANLANVQLQGSNSKAMYSGSSTLPIGNGAGGQVENASTGTITTANGVFGQIISSGAGTILDGAAINAGTPYITTGSITRAYGVYISPQTTGGVGTAYGIDQVGSSDINVLQGHTSIGSNTTTGLLNVGSSGQFQVDSSGDVSIASTASAANILTMSFSAANGSGPAGVVLTNSNATGRAQYVASNDSGATANFGVFGSNFGAIGLNNAAVFGGSSAAVIMSDGNVSNGGADPISFRVGGFGAAQEVARFTTSGATIGVPSAATGTLNLANASSAFTVGLNAGVTTGNSYSLTLPTAVGASGQCLSLTSVTGSTAETLGYAACSGGGGSTLQGAYTASTGGTTPEIIEDSTRTTVDIQAYSGQAADLLDLRGFASVGLGTIEFGVTPAGNATIAGSLGVGGQSVFNTSGVLQSAALSGTYGSVLTLSSTSNSYAGTWNGNTVAVNKGGTGLSSYTSGDLLYANGAASLTTVHISGSSGLCLNSNGANPFWGSCGSGGGLSGSGSANQVAFFNGSTSLTSSASLSWNGSTLTAPNLLGTSSVGGGSFSGTSATFTGAVSGFSLSVGGFSVTNTGQVNTSQAINITTNSGIFLGSSGVNAMSINGSSQLQLSAPGGAGILFTSSGTNIGRLSVNGNLTLLGSLTQNGAPDYDETIYASDNSAAGDVVMADPSNNEHIVKASGAYNSTAVGIVTDGSGSVIDSPEYYNHALANIQTDSLKGVPVALAGRVPVHVTNENGAIMPGDHLTTSSIPGYAMKATQPGPTIGIAYGSFDAATGTVLALVNISYYNPSGSDNVQAANATLDTLTVNGALAASDINIGDMATMKALDVTANAGIGGDLSVGGNLTVTGLTTVQDISVDGHLMSLGASPVVVTGAAAGQSGQVSIDGTDTAGTLTITPKAGSTETLASGVLANITFAKPYTDTPRVVITADNPASLGLQVYVAKTSTGYQLMLNQAAQSGQTYQFDYVIIGSSGTPVSSL